MKSVGEVMAIGRNFKEALQKAIRGLEIGGAARRRRRRQVPTVDKLSKLSDTSVEKITYLERVRYKLKIPNCDRISI